MSLLVTTVALLGGCASSQDCVAPTGPRALTPAKSVALGQGEGVIVSWGGVILATRNLRDTTEIEVVAYPLDRCARPQTEGQHLGRFIALHPGFLEPSDYRPGRLVTATGRIAEAREGSIGEAAYRYAILGDARLRLWPDPGQEASAGWTPRARPYISIGVGGGHGGVGGGVGVSF